MTMTQDQALALQGSAGNAAAVAVQRMPSSTHSSSSRKSKSSSSPKFTFAKSMQPNPGLYTDFADYWVGSAPAPEGYFPIEQHCAYMSAYWLLHGTSRSGLRFLDFDKSTRLRASETVRRWAAEGGSAAQVQYAQDRLGGHQVSGQALINDALSGALPPGTKIWFGNDSHVEAATVTSSGAFLMYDPNTGVAQPRDAQGFADYIASRNVFVVKLGPGADPRTCQCCVVQ